MGFENDDKNRILLLKLIYVFSKSIWKLYKDRLLYNIKMEKYNIKTFIKKSNEIHNNKYDYTNIIWKNVGVKVSIKCNEHGLIVLV